MSPLPDPARQTIFEGLEMAVRAFSGVQAVRVSHVAGREIPEHRHDWPTLTLHIAGACSEYLETGMVRIAGPSATLVPAGQAHADLVDSVGLETFGLVFDPAWLRTQGFDGPLDRPVHWRQGKAGAAARRLYDAWCRPDVQETFLGCATRAFFEVVSTSRPEPEPHWLEGVIEATYRSLDTTTESIARGLGLNQAWLARAYRSATGEGLRETMRRRRVEYASGLMQDSRLPLAEIAVMANFCDQPHMNRCFQTVVGKTPAEMQTFRARS